MVGSYVSTSSIINPSYNKVLNTLRDYISSVYGIIQLCRKYANIIDLGNAFYVRLEDKRFDKSINVIIVYRNNITICIGNNKSIRNDNSLIILERPNNTISPKEIVIRNNTVRLSNVTIIYPGLYNFNCKAESKHSFKYNRLYDSYLTILNESIVINYYTPLPLLVKFVENTKLFDNARNIYINNEYDILKYL